MDYDQLGILHQIIAGGFTEISSMLELIQKSLINIEMHLLDANMKNNKQIQPTQKAGS